DDVKPIHGSFLSHARLVYLEIDDSGVDDEVEMLLHVAVVHYPSDSYTYLSGIRELVVPPELPDFLQLSYCGGDQFRTHVSAFTTEHVVAAGYESFARVISMLNLEQVRFLEQALLNNAAADERPYALRSEGSNPIHTSFSVQLLN